ncbi:hypothetical protein GHT06_016718 [Daphnia sinensis]|uniref:Kinetochore protein Spc24 n=1 Tax=Daphnia sinensis TaxID=1820382 RepID=A0AAD5KNY6_9CRUS|nr:hypothetical protein GHT06_016718 [Daphnia sinensis]
MDLSTPVTPTPQSWANATTNLKKTDIIEIVKKSNSMIPNSKDFLDRQKKAIAVANEKQKALETELSNVEMKLQEHKKALSRELSEIQSAKEDVKNTMSQLTSIQNRIKSLTKEAEDMKAQTSSSNKENISEKCKVDLYRQLTGVTFARHNPNCPHELKGFVACAGPTTNLKTFTFNTAEHSSSLMGGYIWNVLEDMHTKNWEDLSK